jgi:MerR family mercuric resistance operon transcriptional regulator
MHLDQPSEMKVGALAAQAGVHIETIRYYQSIGLMPTPSRKGGAVRRYGTDALRQLRFIKRAQALGFSLEDVKALSRWNSGDNCDEARDLAKRKLEIVEQRIADLESIRSALENLVSACHSRKQAASCPIIESLLASDNQQDGSSHPEMHA